MTNEPGAESGPGVTATLREAVFRLTALIPPGQVTTYGHLARAIGQPRAAREVGWALSGVPPELDLPCHRVVNRLGELSGGWAFGHPDVMRARLEAEGVSFVGPYRVDLAQCLWVPDGDGVG